ncbi:MAG: hypothetical protein OEW68_02545 [Gammaproteobacteria bacterium]|nr:hypothetical protein [Gammaproteobacteria bacterium]MDH4313704.1 hypothetical protein [Gammaproteobacteria bacterium]MDH5212948.1 hypothetical protein [Gammaproteobacteria bacterium]
MFASLSEGGLKKAFALVVAALVLLAAIFYRLQNSGILPGGEIALVKLAWLACTVYFWYLMPLLLLLDRRMPPAARLACKVLLTNMLLRAIAELYLMYVSQSWHPWMGIAHDMFSLGLMLWFLSAAFRADNRPYSDFLLVASLIYVPEGLFALYMLKHASVAGATVYFVPDSADHQSILLATAICVGLLIVYVLVFARRWLHV